MERVWRINQNLEYIYLGKIMIGIDLDGYFFLYDLSSFAYNISQGFSWDLVGSLFKIFLEIFAQLFYLHVTLI